jgi:hypothetical protein
MRCALMAMKRDEYIFTRNAEQKNFIFIELGFSIRRSGAPLPMHRTCTIMHNTGRTASPWPIMRTRFQS